MLTRMKRLLDLSIQKRSPLFRWGFATLSFGAALALRLAIDQALPPGFPFLTFFPAVIVTAFLCGAGPGIALAAASGAAAWYFFIDPVHALVLNTATGMALGFFALISAVDILLIHIMHHALRRLAEETARQSRERELSQQLAESRGIMFQELQHRISNNLQVLASLMVLQRGTVRDPDARRVLDEAAKRLDLIGRLQRRMNAPSGQGIEFGLFLKGLCDDVLRASGAEQVSVTLRAAPLVLPAERSVPVALIVTELISNALEHGFGSRRTGHLTLTLEHGAADGMAVVSVANDGAPPPEGFDPAQSGSLGLRIVQALAQQLGGCFEMRRRDHETVAALAFPVE